MRTSRRWAKSLPLVIFGGLVSLATVPSQAHTTAIRAIPQHGAVVRAVDPNQAKLDPAAAPDCSTNPGAQAWGGTSANIDNPCDVRVLFNQPIRAGLFNSPAPSMTVTKLGLGGGPVSGEVVTADTVGCGVSTGSTAPSAVTLGCLPGDETVIFRRLPDGGVPGTNGPWIALDAGVYEVVATTQGIDGHAPDCNPPQPPPCDPNDPNCVDVINPPVNCYKFQFTIAPTPVAPVITDPTSTSTPDHRNYLVKGTAEPGAAVDIFQGDPSDTTADVKIGSGAADIQGNFDALSGLSAGANQIYAIATSLPNTTSEKKVCFDDDDPVTPCTAPTSTSAAVSFTVTVAPLPDGTAPETVVDDFGAGELFGTTFIQITDHNGDPAQVIMKGHSSDNDQIASLNVAVTDAMGAPVTPGPDTYEVTPLAPGNSLINWEVHIHGLLTVYNVTVSVTDATGNVSDTSGTTATYIVTYGDALAE